MKSQIKVQTDERKEKLARKQKAIATKAETLSLIRGALMDYTLDIDTALRFILLVKDELTLEGQLTIRSLVLRLLKELINE